VTKVHFIVEKTIWFVIVAELVGIKDSCFFLTSTVFALFYCRWDSIGLIGFVNGLFGTREKLIDLVLDVSNMLASALLTNFSIWT